MIWLAGGVRAILQAGDAEDSSLCEHLNTKLTELNGQPGGEGAGGEVCMMGRSSPANCDHSTPSLKVAAAMDAATVVVKKIALLPYTVTKSVL